MSGRPGAFLDRDGTIIRDFDFLNDPARVELLPGAAHAIARLNTANVLTIVVTNQSGIARGLITEEQYELVRARLDTVLAGEGAHIDASFHCPHHPEVGGPCDCRKPGLALYRDAIARFDIDPRRSLFVGDRWRDVAPGLEFGGFAAFIPNDWTPRDESALAARESRVHVAASLADAVTHFVDALPALRGGE